MAYTALYRKFRPNEFEEVKGQEHIVTTLKNQIKADRIGHAYLFCGTRGTGKTTVAKIFAKAVNCEHPVDGSPCGECASCRAIAAGSSMNVIEIDAASNNGVDNIREIREEVNYSPTEGRYKVYIIDEVHMLSIGAFNALLKTLEEPPSYVIFILATTEAHKIPITILSRCQRYDFRRISIDTISARLQELMKAEGVEAEKKAVRYVAKAADGSMRDALSLLDQCIAFYLGQTLTYDHVLEVLGAVDNEIFSKMLRRILKKDITGAIAQLEELVIQGRELGQFITDFTWYLRNLLLVQSEDDMEDVLDISSENLKLLKEEAALVKPEVLMRYIHVCSELSNQIRYSTQKRILIEIAIIKLCRPAMEQDLGSLIQRMDDLEKRLAAGDFVAAVPAGGTGAAASADSGQSPTAVNKRQILPQAVPEDIRMLIKNWDHVLGDMDGLLRNYLRLVTPSLGEKGDLLLATEDSVAVAFLSSEEHQQSIRDAIGKNIGKQVEFRIVGNESGQPFSDVYPDLRSMIQMDIEIEEDSEGGF